MNGYDNWQDERERLLTAVDADQHERVADLIDQAAQSAQASNLADAARRIEGARRVLVGSGLFGRWDDGIWVFSSLIRLIRAMSSETLVPSACQRFLDAIPSVRFDSRMSRAQTKFWYGSTVDKHGEVWISAAIALAVVAYLLRG